MEAKFDITNNEQRSAYRMIERTNNSFFLAGRAGTGKTTFLKSVQDGIKKGNDIPVGNEISVNS